MFALLDCNNFYASCERVFRPDLIGKPIVVLSNNDGCVVARSSESKALGIQMAVPLFSIKNEVKKHDIQVFSSNYTLYGDMSRRVMNSLNHLVPRIEVYSIDEAFLDLHGFREFDQYGQDIRQKIKQWTGIPVSIGIAPTKTLAKIANHIAKRKFPEKGVFVLDNQKQIDKILAKTPVGEVWGIGARLRNKLENQGVFTAAQLQAMPDNWILKNMTVIGLRTVKELRGEPCLEIEEIAPAKKMLITSLSFNRVTDDYEEIKEYVAAFAGKCAEKLRKAKAKANLLSLSLSTNRFNPQVPQYRASETLQFPEATNLSPRIIRLALQAFAQIYRPNYQFKKAQVTLTGLVPEGQVQSHLFAQKNQTQEKKQSKVMEIMDQINQELAPNKVKLAAQGNEDKWVTRREKLSACYTTRWTDLKKIKI